MWDRLIDVWGIPLYWKVLEETDSFTITIHLKGMERLTYSKVQKVIQRKDYTYLTHRAITEGRIAVINALIKNVDKLKDIDALTLECSNGAWIVKGYKMHGKTLTKKVFEYHYSAI